MSSLAENFHNRRDISNFMHLRKAHPWEDVEIGCILVRSFTEGMKKTEVNSQLSQERIRDYSNVAEKRAFGEVWVLELGLKIVGSFSLIYPKTPISDSWIENYGCLRCLALDPKFHGLKLSNLLLRHAEVAAKERGFEGICLHVQRGAERVANLYTQWGYRRDNRGDKWFLGTLIEGYSLAFQSDASAIQFE